MIDYLNSKLIFVENEISSKSEIISKIIDRINENSKAINNKDLFKQKIFERENLGTTGIGRGVAVPHCRSESLDDLVVGIVILKRGIDFNSPDSDLVRIILLVGAPKDKNTEYLLLLSSISKAFRNKEFREELLQVTSTEEIIETFANFVGNKA